MTANDPIGQVEIPLLEAHAKLPDRDVILRAFADHHRASAARAEAKRVATSTGDEELGGDLPSLTALGEEPAPLEALGALDDVQDAVDEAPAPAFDDFDYSLSEDAFAFLDGGASDATEAADDGDAVDPFGLGTPDPLDDVIAPIDVVDAADADAAEATTMMEAYDDEAEEMSARRPTAEMEAAIDAVDVGTGDDTVEAPADEATTMMPAFVDDDSDEVEPDEATRMIQAMVDEDEDEDDAGAPAADAAPPEEDKPKARSRKTRRAKRPKK